MIFCKNFHNFCLLIVFLLQMPKSGTAVAKFTNVQCQSLDKNFTEFTLCRLQAIKRDVVELNVCANLLYMPKQKIEMRWQLLKKASGYKPFLYDIVVPNLCEYLEKRNHPFINIIFTAFGNNTGFNRCPLKEQLALNHFRFPVKSLEILPLPYGEYALFATISFAEKQRALLKVYFMLAEF